MDPLLHCLLLGDYGGCGLLLHCLQHEESLLLALLPLELLQLS
jgi:hypothetical protein